MNRRAWLLLPLLTLLLPVGGRTAPAVQQDIVYGEAGGEKLLLDVYQPEGKGPHPAVVIVHGGGWHGGSRKGHAHTGKWLASQGYTAFSISYRLAPKHPYPAAVEDCARAVRWIRAHAAEYDADARRLGALGDSAGGHLVSLLGLRETQEKGDPSLARHSSKVQAVVNYFGPTDLTRLWQIMAVRLLLSGWLGGTPEEQTKRYVEASPLTHVARRPPPFLTLHGAKDPLVPDEQARLLDAALRAKGGESTLLILEGAGHGWAPSSDYGKQCETAILTFLAKHLR